MVKLEGNPSLSASDLRIRAKTEWKVPIHRFFDSLSPTNSPIRAFISLAALLVKVNAKMEKGSTPCDIR